jgi:hypothetical protein
VRTYEAISSIHSLNVPWNEKKSEFEIQAEIFIRLKNDGFFVRGEYVSGPLFRFDLVVFNNRGKAVAIIEVKNTHTGRRRSLDTLQGAKYRQFGVPVIQFYDLDEYQMLLDFLRGKEKMIDSPVIEERPSVRAARLSVLLNRLKSSAYAAFDASQEVRKQEEKNTLDEIEKSLEKRIESIKSFDSFYSTEKSPSLWRSLNNDRKFNHRV